MAELKVALCHLAPKRHDLEYNRAEIARAFEQAVSQDAQLIMFPELATAGYSFPNAKDALKSAEPADGPTAQLLTELCHANNCYAVCGYLEGDTSQECDKPEIYNSCVVVGPAGVMGHQHKVVRAERWGNKATVRPKIFDFPFGRFGVLICADGYYCHVPEQLVAEGAEGLLIVSAWPVINIDPREIWAARSRKLNIPIIVCNRTGADELFDSLNATSVIYDNQGTRLYQIQSDEPVVQTFTIELTKPAPHQPVPPLEIPEFPDGYRSNPKFFELRAGCEPNENHFVLEDHWREAHLNYAQLAEPGIFTKLVLHGIDAAHIYAPELSDEDLDAVLIGALDRLAVIVHMPDRVAVSVPPDINLLKQVFVGSRIDIQLNGAYSELTGNQFWLPILLDS